MTIQRNDTTQNNNNEKEKPNPYAKELMVIMEQQQKEIAAAKIKLDQAKDQLKQLQVMADEATNALQDDLARLKEKLNRWERLSHD